MNKNGWKQKSIGELCDFTNGYGFSPSDWSGKGLPIIRIQNLNGSQEFNFYEGNPDETWIVMPGDLLFAWAGTRGVSFGPTIWRGSKGVLNQHIYRIHPKDGVDKNWLYYALQVATVRIEAKAHGFKSTLLHVRKIDITKQVVATPEIQEQQKIADLLGSWDEAIQNLELSIVARTEFKGGLKQQLLTGQKRFKEFGNRDWTEHRLGDFLRESRILGSNGKTAKKLTVKLYGKGVIEKRDRIKGSVNTTYYVRRAGQFIYSKLDFLNGAFGVIPQHLDGFESTLDLPAFDVADGLGPQWLFYYVTRNQFYTRYTDAAEGGRKARRVQQEEFLKTKIHLPCFEEQKKIAAVLNASDRELDMLREQFADLKKQKKGLMQKLLTGQIRVKVDEAQAIGV